jgi:phospholipid/cholesterol/gamma-HCH transport system permease protein
MSINSALIQIANGSFFLAKVLRHIVTPPLETKEIINQAYKMGVNSLFLISFTSFLAGIVFTKQSQPSLASFGAESWLPSLVSQAVVRSLGPLITGLICAGKLGSNIGAELGSMRVTEQIDAMEVSSSRPFSYLVISRIVAATIVLPILVVYADIMSLFGSIVMENSFRSTSLLLYIGEVADSVSLLDINASMIKSALFGFAIGCIGGYHGYNASNGTTGVGKAANTAVVTSMISIFIIDLIMLQFLNFFR